MSTDLSVTFRPLAYIYTYTFINSISGENTGEERTVTLIWKSLDYQGMLCIMFLWSTVLHISHKELFALISFYKDHTCLFTGPGERTIGKLLRAHFKYLHSS